MAEIIFYRLADGHLENVLPVLLEKSLAQGWRAVVRAADDESVENFDRKLWSYRDDSFLPHGRLGGGDDSAQPICLTSLAENPNQAELLILLDGAEPFALDVFKRCLYLFDGRDASAVEKARSCKAHFSEHNITSWRQSARGWVKDEGEET